MRRRITVVAPTLALVVGIVAAAFAGSDFGVGRDRTLATRALQLFGIKMATSVTLTGTTTCGIACPTAPTRTRSAMGASGSGR
jgi:hypothetical protein